MLPADLLELLISVRKAPDHLCILAPERRRFIVCKFGVARGEHHRRHEGVRRKTVDALDAQHAVTLSIRSKRAGEHVELFSREIEFTNPLYLLKALLKLRLNLIRA